MGRGRTWWAAVVLTAVVGTAGAPLVMSWAHAVSMLVTLPILGAAMGWALSEEFTSVRRPVLLGAGLFVVPFVLPGFEAVLGAATWVVLVALVLTSPWLAPLRRRVAARVLPSDAGRSGPVPAEEGLRREWIESTRQLRSATDDSDRLVVVGARAEILEELAARGSPLPDYVWDGLRGEGGRDHAPWWS